jgi:hypothetical protein
MSTVGDLSRSGLRAVAAAAMRRVPQPGTRRA